MSCRYVPPLSSLPPPRTSVEGHIRSDLGTCRDQVLVALGGYSRQELDGATLEVGEAALPGDGEDLVEELSGPVGVAGPGPRE